MAHRRVRPQTTTKKICVCYVRVKGSISAFNRATASSAPSAKKNVDQWQECERTISTPGVRAKGAHHAVADVCRTSSHRLGMTHHNRRHLLHLPLQMPPAPLMPPAPQMPPAPAPSMPPAAQMPPAPLLLPPPAPHRRLKVTARPTRPASTLAPTGTLIHIPHPRLECRPHGLWDVRSMSWCAHLGSARQQMP